MWYVTSIFPFSGFLEAISYTFLFPRYVKSVEWIFIYVFNRPFAATILVTNRWNRHRFSLIFWKNPEIYTSYWFAPPEMCLLPPQCWATRILKHRDHYCDTQINIWKGETDTSVSRFLTSIVTLCLYCPSVSWRFCTTAVTSCKESIMRLDFLCQYV